VLEYLLSDSAFVDMTIIADSDVKSHESFVELNILFSRSIQ
jgi:hypothetical protein